VHILWLMRIMVSQLELMLGIMLVPVIIIMLFIFMHIMALRFDFMHCCEVKPANTIT
jgi:hypothetical protein